MDVAQQIRAVAATGLGYLAGAEGDLDAARRWHAEALDTARSAADAPVIAEALAGLADLALREGDPERAAELLGASVAIRGTMDRSVQDDQRVADEATVPRSATRRLRRRIPARPVCHAGHAGRADLDSHPALERPDRQRREHER